MGQAWEVFGLFADEGVEANARNDGVAVSSKRQRPSEDGKSYTAHLKDLDVSKPTCTTSDSDSFCLVDALSLRVTGQHLEPDRAILECRVTKDDPRYRNCGAEGVSRRTVLRRLANIPLVWRPTMLWVQVRHYRCDDCGRLWRQDTSQAAAPRAKFSLHAVGWALKSLVIDRLSIARVAAALGASWHIVNDAVLAAGRDLLMQEPTRLDGVDEHCWRHTGTGSRYVTEVIDLIPARERRGPARLLDMVEGRSEQVFTTWLAARDQSWRDQAEVVATDGFTTGLKTATSEELPDATAVMDPFYVVAIAGDALGRTRQRVQRETSGRRGRSGGPFYGARRTLRTGADLLTEAQGRKLPRVFSTDEHVEVEAIWAMYQKIVAAYRRPNTSAGKQLFIEVIDSLRRGVPRRLPELISLGRTLKRWAVDVLAYFHHPGTSNGPTEAINGRLEHLRGTALGFRNLGNYITRALLDTGGFRPLLPPHLR